MPKDLHFFKILHPLKKKEMAKKHYFNQSIVICVLSYLVSFIQWRFECPLRARRRDLRWGSERNKTED